MYKEFFKDILLPRISMTEKPGETVQKNYKRKVTDHVVENGPTL